MKLINNIQKWIARASLAVAAVGMATIAVSVTVSVICRYILQTSAMWVEQYTRYMLIWVVFVAANVLIYRNELMRVDFLDHLWPKKAMKVREGFYSALFVVILGTLCFEGWRQAYSYWGVQVVGLPVDKFWIYLSVPVGSLLMLIQYLLNLVKAFFKEKGGDIA